MNDFNVMAENRNAVSFEETEQNEVVGSTIDSKNGVCRKVELAHSIINAASKARTINESYS